MASNGLIANAEKTVFMVLNYKGRPGDPTLQIPVGNSMVEQSKHTKLLGMTIEENQSWINCWKMIIFSHHILIGSHSLAHILHQSLSGMHLCMYTSVNNYA